MVKNIFVEKRFLVFSNYGQMHQNTFLTTPDGKKYLFWKKVSGGLEVCANASKLIFKHSWRSKNSFWRNVSGGLEMCANACKHILNTPGVQKNLFWKKVSGGLEACANASKHVFNHSRRSEKYFLKKCFWWSVKCAQML